MQNKDLFNFKLPDLNRFLKSDFTGEYCLSGLNPPLILLILNYILNENKKVLLITYDEQSVLK